MRNKWIFAVLPTAILILALVLPAGCMQEAGDDGGGGGDGEDNSDYTSLDGAWNYTGRFENGDGSCYEDHLGTASFIEQGGILKISLSGTYQNSDGGAGAGEFTLQEGQINTALQKVEFPETVIGLNGGACHFLLVATGRWDDYQHFSLTGWMTALDCSTFYVSDLEMGFSR